MNENSHQSAASSAPGDGTFIAQSEPPATAPQQTPSSASPASTASSGPVVEVPPGSNVINVLVVPGETVILPPPFNSESDIAAKIGEGNLALKVGDVTVILRGYVEANDQAPITVETAREKPIDVATILASTDPNLDIQTAAGPAVGAQGAENGHFLALFGGAPGLGGLTAVGPLDQTSLNYRLIDNTIRQELSEGQVEGNGPEGNPPGIGNSSALVDEAGLSFGSMPASDSETARGAVLVVAPGGVASITVGGVPVDLQDPGKTGPIDGSHGTLTITGWDPATGELDYSYTLKDNVNHDPVQGRNVATGVEDFPVTVTDKNGETAGGDVTIDVKDDVPTACADSAITCACGDASGNVLANDTSGADGIVSIVAFKDGSHVYSLDGKGNLTSNDNAANYSYDQATGVLEIFKTSGGGALEIDLTGDHTGDYAYSQGTATAADTFQYTVIDGDGDTATASLAIQPDLSPPVAADDHIFAFTADFSVANAWLLSNDQPDNRIALTDTGNADHLSVGDLGWGQSIVLDGGATSGGFDYEITANNGKTDTAHVDVTQVSDPGHAIDQSKSSGDAIILGDDHDNTLAGGSGDDVIVGGDGKDQLFGNGGNDTFLYDTADRFDGGAGTDSVDFAGGSKLGFDAGFVGQMHAVEVLDFRNGGADTLGAGGKGEALSVDAVLDMTDGKGEIWFAAESSDSITLDSGFTRVADVTNTTPLDGIPTGTYATYTATDGLHTAVVHIDTQAMVHT